jgi:hypothetical protein
MKLYSLLLSSTTATATPATPTNRLGHNLEKWWNCWTYEFSTLLYESELVWWSVGETQGCIYSGFQARSLRIEFGWVSHACVLSGGIQLGWKIVLWDLCLILKTEVWVQKGCLFVAACEWRELRCLVVSDMWGLGVIGNFVAYYMLLLLLAWEREREGLSIQFLLKCFEWWNKFLNLLLFACKGEVFVGYVSGIMTH